MQSESTVKHWAQSTERRIDGYFDKYLVKNSQEGVRASTAKLLESLFKKANNEQRQAFLLRMRKQLQELPGQGRCGKQLLDLTDRICCIFEPSMIEEKRSIFELLVSQLDSVFEQVKANPEEQFYAFCANYIDFQNGGSFPPYLLEANGCGRCYEVPSEQFKSMSIFTAKEEIRTHLNQVTFILPRIYEIKNLKVTMTRKKVQCKNVFVYYINPETDKKVQACKVEAYKIGGFDSSPLLGFTTSTIIIQFDTGTKHKGMSDIVCINCSKNSQYSMICERCVCELMDVEGQFKVVGGDARKIQSELQQLLNNIQEEKQNFYAMYLAFSTNSRPFPLFLGSVFQDLKCNYSNIMLNLGLLSKKNTSVEVKDSYGCYSCLLFLCNSLLSAIDSFLKDTKSPIFETVNIDCLNKFLQILAKVSIKSDKELVVSIVTRLLTKESNFLNLPCIETLPSSDYILIICKALTYYRTPESQFTPVRQGHKLLSCQLANRVRVAVEACIPIEQQQLCRLPDIGVKNLKELRHLSRSEFQAAKSIVPESLDVLLKHNLDKWLKIYLWMTKDFYGAPSVLGLRNPQILDYVVNLVPSITESNLLSCMVFNPAPLIKLNQFSVLPRLVQNASLNHLTSMVSELCQVQDYWNPNMRDAVNLYMKRLSELERPKQIAICLSSFQKSRNVIFLKHLHSLLVPIRSKFIIRMDVPEAEMKKDEQHRGGAPVEYVYLPVREVCSQDLDGDTMRALHDWVTTQMQSLNQDMPFDLIVDKFIIDNMDLPLEVVFNKIVQNKAVRSQGSQSYNFFRVIYRIQGIFGEANERAASNPRDDKLEECLNESKNLLSPFEQLNRKVGIEVLIGTFQEILNLPEPPHESITMMLSIFQVCFMNEAFVQTTVKLHCEKTIVSCFIRCFSMLFARKNKKLLESVIEVCCRIIDSANKEIVSFRKNSVIGEINMDISSQTQGAPMQQEGPSTLKSHEQFSTKELINILLEKITECERQNRKQTAKKLIKLLPFCTKDKLEASELLYEYFGVTNLLESRSRGTAHLFLAFLETLSESYVAFKQKCRQSNLVSQMLVLLNDAFRQPIEEWVKIMEDFQFFLSILKGLIQGDIQLQRTIQENGMLMSIYNTANLKQTQDNSKYYNKVNRICSLSYEIIKYFKEGKIVDPSTLEFIGALENEKKSKNLEQRAKKKSLLEEKRQKALGKFATMCQAQEESQPIECSVCREGYMKRQQVLGVYVYLSQDETLPLDNWWNATKKVPCLSSVSYFLPIHLACHIKAHEADQRLNKPQWDGALIRNNDVLCNSWVPFKGPKTSDGQFDSTTKKYFDKNGNRSKPFVVFADLNCLLDKFSHEYNFSEKTKGSSAVHNCKLLLTLVGLVAFYLKQSDDTQKLNEGCKAIEANPHKKLMSINYYLCAQIFTCSEEDFAAKRENILRLIELNCLQFGQQRSLLIYLLLVDRIKKVLATRKSNHSRKLIASIDENVAANFLTMLGQFEAIAEQYRNDMLRVSSLQHCAQLLGLRNWQRGAEFKPIQVSMEEEDQ